VALAACEYSSLTLASPGLGLLTMPEIGQTVTEERE
jgi:hypothetical protein